MKHLTLLSSLVLVAFAFSSSWLGRAEAGDTDDDERSDDDEAGLVLVNAAQKLGDTGQIAKLRKVLDARGLLHRLPRHLEAALDGRAVQIGDLEGIKEAVANQEYETALAIIEEDETRILAGAASGDPLPALAELAEWRGRIEAATNNEDAAIEWFRAAHRFNSARSVDKPSPRVRRLIKKAHQETSDVGRLRVIADPETAEVQIDGRKAVPAATKIELAVGWHLVTITADGRTSYSELVNIREGKLEKLPIALEEESTDDRAARLVDATVSAPPGKARLKKAKALSRVTGTKRYLMIEDTGEDHITLRLYDIDMKKVSRPVDLLDSASSATIMRLVNAALDPDNMIDATRVTVIQTERPQRWYERWYVWVGVGAVLGGSVLTYQYMSREPTSVRGF